MENENESEVSLDSLDAALNKLVKAADDTDLSKGSMGVAIDQGGHVDNRGQTSGGYPSQGDVGGLDSMMVGKMQEALIEQGFTADQITAFMGKDDEEEMEGKMGKPADTSGGVGTNPRTSPSAGGCTMAKMEDEEEEDEDEEAEKSLRADLAKSFADDDRIADAVDVSPFLDGLVDQVVTQIGSLAKSMEEDRSAQNEVNASMAKAMQAMGEIVKSIAHRVGAIEKQPNPQKGVTRLSGAQPVRKSFGQFGSEGQGQGEQLTKSDVVRTLSYMNLEKGITEIQGQPTSELIGLAEAGGQVHPNAVRAVQRFLTTHPGEASTARSYR